MSTYTIFAITICTRQRIDDWIAELADNPSTWEVGRTESEAIGKLVITLMKGKSE